MIKAIRVDLPWAALPVTMKKSKREGGENDDLLGVLLLVGVWLELDGESSWKNQKKLSDFQKCSTYFAPGLVRTTIIILNICD